MRVRSGPVEASDQRSVVVVGASAGGVEALTALARALPADFPAPICVVLHMPASGTSVLPAILGRAGALPATQAEDGARLEPSHVYVAPPDRHLSVDDGRMRLTHGPSENGHRPSIDTLFRSAASVYGTGAIGLILSGTLDDGTAGLSVIKANGGIAVVQDPNDAAYDGMLRSAIEHVDVDHVVALADMVPLLLALVAGAPPVRELGGGSSPSVIVEGDMPEDQALGITCPACGGALWSIEEAGVDRYRCRVGHAYSEDSLVETQGSDIEAALWSALRALEERAALMRRISTRAARAGNDRTAMKFERKAHDADRQAEIIRAGVLPVSLEVGGAAEETA